MISQGVVRLLFLSPGWCSSSCVYRRISSGYSWWNRNGPRTTHQNGSGKFTKRNFFGSVINSRTLSVFLFSSVELVLVTRPFVELKAQNSKQIPGDKSDQKLRHVVTSHDVMNHDVRNRGVMNK